MPPILIISFHRSGSSLVAQLLGASGFHLGDKLLGAKPSNRYGHFEDTEVIQFHDRLLGSDGHSWYSDRGPVSMYHDSALKWISLYAVRKSAHHAAYGVKDPRLCLTIRHWEAALGRVRVIFIHRGAQLSTMSLWTRALEDFKAGKTVPLNKALVTNPDHIAKIYLHNISSFLSWYESYSFAEEDVIMTTYEDLISGKFDLISEVQQKWDYNLRSVQIQDYFDGDAVTVGKRNALNFKKASVISALRKTNEQLERLCES